MKPMNCQFRNFRDEPHCSNEARYLTATGTYYCGIHDAQVQVASVRISDLPRLISKVTLMMRNDPTMGDEMLDQLKELVCHSGA